MTREGESLIICQYMVKKCSDVETGAISKPFGSAEPVELTSV